MKKTVRTGGRGWKLPTEEEVEVAGILLSLPKLIKKEELIKRYSFTWGRSNKRSVPEPSSAAVEADASAGGESSKAPPSSSSSGLKLVFKRKAKDELMEVCNKMHEAMESQHEQNLKLKAKEVQETSCSRNMEGSDHMWNYSLMKTVDEQQVQMTMFAPPTQQHDLCLPKLVDPDNDNDKDKLVGVSNFELCNHRETYDFMGLSKPLDQSDQCLVMDDDLRARNAAAAAARKNMILKLKENKNFNWVAKKLSRNRR